MNISIISLVHILNSYTAIIFNSLYIHILFVHSDGKFSVGRESPHLLHLFAQINDSQSTWSKFQSQPSYILKGVSKQDLQGA